MVAWPPYKIDGKTMTTRIELSWNQVGTGLSG